MRSFTTNYGATFSRAVSMLGVWKFKTHPTTHISPMNHVGRSTQTNKHMCFLLCCLVIIVFSLVSPFLFSKWDFKRDYSTIDRHKDSFHILFDHLWLMVGVFINPPNFKIVSLLITFLWSPIWFLVLFAASIIEREKILGFWVVMLLGLKYSRICFVRLDWLCGS